MNAGDEDRIRERLTRECGNGPAANAAEADDILAALPAELWEPPGDEPWGGANLANCGDPQCPGIEG